MPALSATRCGSLQGLAVLHAPCLPGVYRLQVHRCRQDRCQCKNLQTLCMFDTQVNYINAHATSTLVGDVAEVKAVKQVGNKHLRAHDNSFCAGRRANTLSLCGCSHTRSTFDAAECSMACHWHNELCGMPLKCQAAQRALWHAHALVHRIMLRIGPMQVFSDWSNIKMNGTKSMIGHCLGAAGGLEAVATIQAIITGWVHPTINQVCDRTCSG